MIATCLKPTAFTQSAATEYTRELATVIRKTSGIWAPVTLSDQHSPAMKASEYLFATGPTAAQTALARLLKLDPDFPRGA